MRQRRRHHRIVFVLAAGLLLGAACSDNEEGAADGTAVSTSGAPATDVTSPGTEGTGGAATTGDDGTAASDTVTAEIPSVANQAWDVVLVASDDTLSVREQPDPASAKVSELAWNAVGVTTTGETAKHDGTPWYRVVSGGATGWVNATYLTPQQSDQDFASMTQPRQVLDDMATALAARGNLLLTVSSHGLYVDDRPRMFHVEQSQLDKILTDATVRSWIGPACGDPCLSATFADHVAVPFVSAYDDTDTAISVDDLVSGPSNRIPESIIPPQFAGFHHLTVFDPGDDPAAGGLDWSTWYVFFDREPLGDYRVVGLSNDVWAP